MSFSLARVQTSPFYSGVIIINGRHVASIKIRKIVSSVARSPDQFEREH